MPCDRVQALGHLVDRPAHRLHVIRGRLAPGDHPGEDDRRARCGSRRRRRTARERPSTCHGGSTSSTSWPSERSSSAASATAFAHTGSTAASAIGGSVVAAIRSLPGVACGGRAQTARRGRRPGGIAGLVAGEHVEDRRGVGDGAREHAVDHQRATRPARAPRRCARALGFRPDQAAAGGGDADRAAAVVAVGDRHHARPRPRRRSRRRSRRGCARGPRGCGSGRTGAPRWSAGCRTRAAWSCPRSRSRRPSGGASRCGRSRQT